MAWIHSLVRWYLIFRYLLTHPVYVWIFVVIHPTWPPNPIKVILLLLLLWSIGVTFTRLLSDAINYLCIMWDHSFDYCNTAVSNCGSNSSNCMFVCVNRQHLDHEHEMSSAQRSFHEERRQTKQKSLVCVSSLVMFISNFTQTHYGTLTTSAVYICVWQFYCCLICKSSLDDNWWRLT